MKKIRVTYFATQTIEDEIDDDLDVDSYVWDMRGMWGEPDWDYQIEYLE